MTDRLIVACRWFVDAEAEPYKQRALDNCRGCYTTLLDFFREEGLLTDPSFGQRVSDWRAFEMRESHLTPEGLALYARCEPLWRCGYGKESSQRHLLQWKRRLAEMRGLPPV